MVINMKSDSLLLRLATVYGEMKTRNRDIDICMLTRRCLLGLLKIACIVIVSSAFLLPLTDTILQVIVWLQTGVFEPNASVWIVTGLLGALAILASAAYAAHKIEQHLNRPRLTPMGPISDPGMIVKMYRSWKEKTCVPIEIVDSK